MPLDEWMKPNGKVKVLSTTAMIGDMVSQIGGEYIDPLSLILGEVDPHSYELVKGDEEKFSNAQIVFYNGLGLEHGASLRYQLDKHPHALGVGDAVRKKHPDLILMKGAQVDPHIWMDMTIWLETIDPIIHELSLLDPLHASYYEQNGSQLKTEIMQTHEKIIEKMASLPPKKKYLVTSHDAFQYFSRRYLGAEGERCTAPEGLAPDGQLSCYDIQRIIDHLFQYRVSVVFPESNVSKDSLRKITSACKEKGLYVKVSEEVLYADALGPKGSSADTYLKMMDHNTEVLLHEWE